MNYQFKQLKPQELPRLNHFLKQNKQGKAGKNECVFTLESEQIVATARLIPLSQPNQYWLRGVFVMEELRGQGLGTELLSNIQKTIEHDIEVFTFPLPHLKRFYHNLGYIDCRLEELPEALQLRFKSAQLNRKKWLSMRLGRLI